MALAACAGDGPTDSGGSSDFDRIQREIFNVSCVSGVCHNTQTQAGNLVLVQGQSYGELVGVAPDNAAARAKGLLRVRPFDPATSFLLVKLVGPADPAEGAPMPLGEARLAPDLIELVRSWIATGAAPGGDPSPTPSPSATVAATATSTFTPSTTATQPPSPTPSATHTPTGIPTATSGPPTVTGTRPPTATATAAPPATPTPSITATEVPSPTATPTATPTETPTSAPTPTVTAAPGSSFAAIQADIFDTRCAIPGCHTDELAPFNGDLSLEEDSSYADLVDVVPMNAVARAAGFLRVDPGVPENSFLLRKVTGPGPGEGTRMPLTGPPLSPQQIESIRNWIARGAVE